jgi:hypothetical protein
MDEKERLFLELIDGFKWRYDLDKNIRSLFINKDGEDIIQFFNKLSINKKKIIASYRLGIEQDLKGYLIRTSKQFRLNFDMEQEDYDLFIEDMMIKHFKIKIVCKLWYTA